MSINVVLHSLNFFPLLYDSLDTLTFLLNLNIEIKKRAKQTKKMQQGKHVLSALKITNFQLHILSGTR